MQFSDKPKNMPLKDYIILKLAERLQIPKATVTLVLQEHFKAAAEAFQDPKNLSIEISGFGTFFFSERRGLMMEKGLTGRLNAIANKEALSNGPELAENVQRDLDFVIKKLEYAKASKADSGRLDKHSRKKTRG